MKFICNDLNISSQSNTGKVQYFVYRMNQMTGTLIKMEETEVDMLFLVYLQG